MPRRLALGLPIWLAAVAAFWLQARGHDGGALAMIEGGLADLTGSAWLPVGLLAAYLVRPLLLVPMTILTAFTGYALGPVAGAAFAAGAVLASASVAYGVARFLGAGRSPDGPWWRALQGRSFEAIVAARLMLVPGDLVNYASGALRIGYPPFALATLLGGLPGLMIGVLAGASVEGTFSFDGVRLNAGYLLASGVLLVASLTLARLLRRTADLGAADESPTRGA